MKIEPEKYYRPTQVFALVPAVQGRSVNWLLKCIRGGNLKAVNTNPNGQPPRYLIKGEEIMKFIEGLGS